MEVIVKQEDANLLEPLLDSYQRNNTILLNLLNALPEGGLEANAMAGSPSVAKLFTHIHDVRYFFVSQTAPEFASNIPELFQEGAEHNPARITQMLNDSAKAVRDAVKSRIKAGQKLKGKNVTYDHPILLLQHMLWHEGYHVGQIKLALKAIGFVMNDEDEMNTIWNLWRTETWES
jgi:uncharacterized damage-inducible protein DinB